LTNRSYILSVSTDARGDSRQGVQLGGNVSLVLYADALIHNSPILKNSNVGSVPIPFGFHVVSIASSFHVKKVIERIATHLNDKSQQHS
jgi:hypothetical protein